jgi:hypothetical protein
LDVVPSLQVTIVPPLEPLEPLEAAVAGAAGAAGAAAAAVPADLFTPPWPLQAPRPPFDVVPSLQVTVVPELDVVPEALDAAGALAAAGASAGAALPEEADLFTPPCPLQAPRPPFDVVPSLQVTVVAVPVDCAIVIAGALIRASDAAAPQINPQSFATFMCSTPLVTALLWKRPEYNKAPGPALEPCGMPRIADGADGVGSAPHEPA